MKKIILLICLIVLGASAALAQPGMMDDQHGDRPGPPPEAYTACDGKQVGDSAQMTTPNGDTITGTCEQEGDRLVLRPDSPPDGRMAPPAQ
ncbi:hypothetical protein [Maridesulfovibrio sp.]|uniref:hypothetical protein n=1 Tax=Maridesulfovibrio sp. TaxID=2795000 RepID=UPI002A18AE47|nr:hypothetical protein [Maridesulfovibrio sp.]